LHPASLQAADGVLITEKSTTGAKIETRQIQIERNRMRVEVTDPNGSPQTIIFDGAKQVLWIIDPAKKSYIEMTKADADALAGQMSAATTQMQEMMKNMPPDQRAQMEAMMRGRGMPAAPAAPSKTEYRKVGADRVGKWACDKYDGALNNQKTTEVCTVAPSALGLAAADFEVSKQMSEFFGKLVPQGADNMFKIGGAEPTEFSGIPVRRISSVGQAQTVTEVTDVARQTFPESTFAVPAGFQKNAQGFGGRGR